MTLTGHPHGTGLTLELSADTRWIPVVQGLIENGAPILGLDAGKTLRLSMSAEELVAHLAGSAPGSRMTLILARRQAMVSADFVFETGTDGLWAMNLTAAKEITQDQGMDHMGLLLASRMTDSFAIALTGRQVTITLNQSVAYPEIKPALPVDAPLRGSLSVTRNPQPAEVTLACSLALGAYPGTRVPGFFRTPGAIIDQMAAGVLHMAILTDGAGTQAGMISWEMASPQSIGFYGPFVFGTRAGEAGAARILTDQMISGVARTSALIVYSILATPDLPAGDFERLACLDFKRQDQPPGTLWFRHLREDMGRNVWAHPAMSGFLKETYDRLFLMRTIHETQNLGQNRPHRSLLAAQLDTGLRQAMLTPMLDGSDIRENISRHVSLLKAEGFLTILFTLDLASGWQAAMGGALMENGFIPAYVLPYAGDSDKAVFHHVDTDA
ncbi:MAG: hypothetical protein V1793_03340 [Pseudomonadota bacterium]